MNYFAGDYRNKGTPLPIPNREVKLVYANGTGTSCSGRVGGCRLFILKKWQ